MNAFWEAVESSVNSILGGPHTYLADNKENLLAKPMADVVNRTDKKSNRVSTPSLSRSIITGCSENQPAKPTATIVHGAGKNTPKPSEINLPRPLMAGGSENRLGKPPVMHVHRAGKDLFTPSRPNLPRTIMEEGRECRLADPGAGIVEMVVEETPEPPSVFPLLKLPPELRMMVYKFHFFQKPSHLNPIYCVAPKTCGVGQSICRLAYVNHDVPLQQLWLSCKTIYDEAMPIFFSTREFRFENIERLGEFLTTVGPYHRQHLTSIGFDYEKAGATGAFDVHEAFRLLGECPTLKKLSIRIHSHYIGRKRATLPGFSTLLKIRGIKNLEVTFFDAYWIAYLYGPALDDAKKLVTNKIEKLKDPYSPAEMKRREAKGITKYSEPRTNFTSKTESRAARFSRRQQLKELA
ncbi:MAG: hypothetical protein Q9216_007166 [Gyalolechia sp. 2 TL-2023]